MRKKAVARAKYVRTSPQKARLVLDLIRGRPVKEARRILRFSNRRVARPILKTLESAVSNARQEGLKEARLRIKRAVADSGPSFKRVRFASRGRIGRLLKRTTHLMIELTEDEE